MISRPDTPFYFIFLGGLFAVTFIGLGSRHKGETQVRITPDSFLLALTFVGMGAVPLFYIFTSRLNPFTYRLPLWAGYIGTFLLAGSIVLLWRAHADLGQNWSITPRILADQKFVTNGVYHYMRHPIYASYWLWAFAQPLLLHNWVAGFSMLATFAPLYLYRVPREEEMMIGAFGEEYIRYMHQTPAILPLKRKPVRT